MVQEFPLPLNEGPFPVEPKFLRIFQPGEIPFQIGSLERNALSYLGDWHSAMDGNGYGMAWRFGIKDGVRDSDGDLAKLVILFGNPLKKSGLEINTKIMEEQQTKFGHALRDLTMEYSKECDNVVGIVIVPPPSYMLRELVEMLK